MAKFYQGAVHFSELKGQSSSPCMKKKILFNIYWIYFCVLNKYQKTNKRYKKNSMPLWLSRLRSLCTIKPLPALFSAVTNLCLAQCVPTDGCLVQPSIASIKETGTDPRPREHWTIPSCYALLNLHLCQHKVTPSLMHRHKDMYCIWE